MMNKKVKILAGMFIIFFFIIFSTSSIAIAENSIGGIIGGTLNKFQNLNNTTNNSPEIFSVSTVYPTNNQTIVIKGIGFGTHFSFNGDSRFIEITDMTRNWSAGWSGDMVHLYITSWTNNEIIINGFTGSYGNGSWSLMPGDDVTVRVWNPQLSNSQNGNDSPAVYNLQVALQ
ncbi:MAG: hypothetical protein EVG15_07365 [Candidatus Acididesulfobacter diazotrophicus]|uniref:Uncharacterized protein n=1 Tax=Candidatus Acididesulfobacter diazotrophicus TaxID=2597226 RepID=A0A519BLJ2_9DELT|nr:MAG: hypothetical protein EVG15_07365 [Candidatus Acididesulfobacter diazotrophicus]